MSPDEAPQYIRSNLTVLREDIARAKSCIMQHATGRTEGPAGSWLKDQGYRTAKPD